ncbi:MAG: hypothetical protein KC897_05850, partial [Candidatus Omnitrophica bacterium]|nr:hypothetical protein [Candidatus Omnitrophota bacterium]
IVEVVASNGEFRRALNDAASGPSLATKIVANVASDVDQLNLDIARLEATIASSSQGSGANAPSVVGIGQVDSVVTAAALRVMLGADTSDMQAKLAGVGVTLDEFDVAGRLKAVQEMNFDKPVVELSDIEKADPELVQKVRKNKDIARVIVENAAVAVIRSMTPKQFEQISRQYRPVLGSDNTSKMEAEIADIEMNRAPGANVQEVDVAQQAPALMAAVKLNPQFAASIASLGTDSVDSVAVTRQAPVLDNLLRRKKTKIFSTLEAKTAIKTLDIKVLGNVVTELQMAGELSASEADAVMTGINIARSDPSILSDNHRMQNEAPGLFGALNRSQIVSRLKQEVSRPREADKFVALSQMANISRDDLGAALKESGYLAGRDNILKQFDKIQSNPDPDVRVDLELMAKAGAPDLAKAFDNARFTHTMASRVDSSVAKTKVLAARAVEVVDSDEVKTVLTKKKKKDDEQVKIIAGEVDTLRQISDLSYKAKQFELAGAKTKAAELRGQIRERIAMASGKAVNDIDPIRAGPSIATDFTTLELVAPTVAAVIADGSSATTKNLASLITPVETKPNSFGSKLRRLDNRFDLDIEFDPMLDRSRTGAETIVEEGTIILGLNALAESVRGKGILEHETLHGKSNGNNSIGRPPVYAARFYNNDGMVVIGSDMQIYAKPGEDFTIEEIWTHTIEGLSKSRDV